MVNVQNLADRLLHILPLDGSQVPNATARTLLGQAIERPISGEVYFEALDLLENRGQIRRGRGRGGAVRRAEAVNRPPGPPSRVWVEVYLAPRATVRLNWPTTLCEMPNKGKNKNIGEMHGTTLVRRVHPRKHD